MPNHSRTLFALAVPAVMALAAGAYYVTDIARPVPSQRFETTTLGKGTIRKLVATSGPVRALVTVSVGSQLSGQVTEVQADFNSEVTKGQILAVIDTRTFETKVVQAKADLEAARAALANQQAALIKTQAVLRLALRTVGRQAVLSRKGYSTKAAMDIARRDADVAKAEIGIVNAQIRSANAVIQQREAQLKQAEIDYERTNIRAPIAGTVISRTVDMGQTVAASLQAPELFQIAQDLRRVKIEAQVNEADVGAIAVGNPSKFTVDAYPERSFIGTVKQVRLAATELNNVVTYTIIIESTNDDRRLFPGMTANVQIETASRDNALRLASDALRFKPHGLIAPASSRKSAGRARRGRLLARLRDELQLTDEQVKAVRSKMRSAFKGQRGGRRRGGESADGGAGRANRDARRARRALLLDGILQPLLTDKQRELYAGYKKGRHNIRIATVWVLGADKTPEPRRVRLGISDDQFTEVVGGRLVIGDRIITRMRKDRR